MEWPPVRSTRPAAASLPGDTLVALALAACGCALSILVSARFSDAMYAEAGFDLWFQADQPRYFANILLTAADGNHGRTTVHPAFSILFYPLAKSLTALGIAPFAAAMIPVASAAGASAALFYLALRNLSIAPSAAGAFTLGFLSTSGFMFWCGVVETYIFSTLSVCVMLWVLTKPVVLGRATWILASALTLSVTITNWSLGLAAAFFRFPFREFLRISAAAFAVVLVLALAQKLVFPSAGVFLDARALIGERWFSQVYTADPQSKSWTPAANMRVILLHAAVTPMPQHDVVAEWRVPRHVVSNQNVRVGDHTPLGLAATVLWVCLLAGGVLGCVTSPRRDVSLTLGAFTLGQIGLHLVYGSVTFLYAAHFIPALVAIAACGALTPARRVVTVLALLFAGLAGLSNWLVFTDAVALANALASAPPR